MQDRPADPSLIAPLIRDCHRYSFFQLVQLLQRASGGAGVVMPGGGGPAQRETIRFRPSTTLGFAAADVESVDLTKSDTDGEEDSPSRFQITVNFMGLYGPASPMPNHFTEEILWAGPEGQAARGFLDLFHHRLISFVYRAWEKYRPYIQFSPAEPDRFTKRLLCMIGLGTPGMVPSLGDSYLPLLRVTGLLSGHPRSAVGLEGILRDRFEGIPVRIDSFTERNVTIGNDQTVRLGVRSSRLGEDLVLGEQVEDRGGAFEVALGPLPAEDFRRFLPGSPDFDRLVRTVRFYVTDALVFSVRLQMRMGEAPHLTLSPEANLPLGRMSWISPGPSSRCEVLLATNERDPVSAHGVTTPRQSEGSGLAGTPDPAKWRPR